MTKLGRCPHTDKILLKTETIPTEDFAVVCPSCTNSFHPVGLLEWQEQ